jgi:hypothetical protein
MADQARSDPPKRATHIDERMVAINNAPRVPSTGILEGMADESQERDDKKTTATKREKEMTMATCLARTATGL